MKQILTIIVLLTGIIQCYCQRVFEQEPIVLDWSSINHYKNDLKEGLWCEQSGNSITLCYYHNGVRNGLQRVYKKASGGDCYYLYFVAVFENGNSICPEYYFYETGMPEAVVLEKSELQDFHTSNVEYAINERYQAYIQLFDETTGQLKAEGWTILFGEYESHREDVGQWKIYDLNGNYKIIQQQ